MTSFGITISRTHHRDRRRSYASPALRLRLLFRNLRHISFSLLVLSLYKLSFWYYLFQFSAESWANIGERLCIQNPVDYKIIHIHISTTEPCSQLRISTVERVRRKILEQVSYTFHPHGLVSN